MFDLTEYGFPDVDGWTCDSEVIEGILFQWEASHIQDLGFPICKDLVCYGNYVMLKKMYEYRVKTEKLKRNVILHSYRKTKLEIDSNITMRCYVMGTCTCELKVGDNVVLMGEEEGMTSLYKVMSVRFIQQQKAMKTYEMLVEFMDIEVLMTVGEREI